jgi:DNA-binding NtrC family response regulator
MNSVPCVLIVDDDHNALSALEMLVRREGFEVETAGDLASAAALAGRRPFAAVLVDYFLPDGAGLELLQQLPEPRPDVVLVTGQATVETAVEALRAGAIDYLTKPVDVARLKAVLRGVARTGSFRREIHSLREELRELGRFGSLVGSSPPMQAIYDRLARVAPSEATVLVTGESGTGKELVAETVHRLSRRADRALVTVHAGAISANLIESELFGHERGSFTGADRMHKGVFERADQGTLFLDEISEMPIELQAKLLRVLEVGTFTRVGGEKQVAVDVRIVAASNRDLDEAVAAGKFRGDLLYRLRVVPIELPPLREREGDVAALAQYFLGELGRANGAAKAITPAALAALSRYSYPGNVRELRNAVHQAYVLAEEMLDLEHLPPAIASSGALPARNTVVAPKPGSVTFEVPVGLAEVERRLILATLASLGDNKAKAAEVLGISLKTLYSRLREYGGRDSA